MAGFFNIVGGSNGSTSVSSPNYSKNILVGDWVLVDSGDYSGMYKATITHNLKSTNLITSIYENNKISMVNVVNILNENSIEVYNDEVIECKIVINAGVLENGITLKTFTAESLT